MENKFDGRKDTINYLKAAMVIFLVSAGFIAYKLMIAYRHNERWKDYDECGMQ